MRFSGKFFTAISTLFLSVLFFSAVPLSAQAATSTFTVNNANDSGAGSLRQAITDCSALGGSDDCVISLENSGGTQTLNLVSALPVLTRPAVFSNAGVDTDLLINGASASGSYCLRIESGVNGSVHTIVEGLAFTSCPTAAIVVANVSTDVQIGNTNSASDIVSIFSGSKGIKVDGDNAVIQNTVFGVNLSNAAAGQSGNSIDVSSFASNVTIDSVTSKNATTPNINIDTVSTVSITDSLIADSTSNSIRLLSVTNATMSGNTITNAGGVFISGGSSFVITNNTITNTSTNGTYRAFTFAGSVSDVQLGAASSTNIATDGNVMSVAASPVISAGAAILTNFQAAFNLSFQSSNTNYLSYDSGMEPFTVPSSLVATTTSIAGTAGVSSGTVSAYQNGVFVGSKALSGTSFTFSGGDLNTTLTGGANIVVLVRNTSGTPTSTSTVVAFDGLVSSFSVTPSGTSANFSFSSTETITPKVYIATSEGGLSGATPTNGTLGTSHSVNVTGLSGSTLYYYRLDTVSAAGSQTRTGAQSGTFTTSFSGAISSLSVTPAATSANFSFSSTETLTPKIYVATSLGGLSGATPVNGTLGTTHSVNVTGLTVGVLYYYRIDAVASDGTTTVTGVSSSTFTTVDNVAPVLQSFTTSSISGRYGPGAVITITATYNETINASSTMQITLNNSGTVSLSGVGSTATLTGTYTVPSTGAGGGTADLTVSSINSEGVVDLAASPNTRTNSSVPSGSNNIGGAKDLVIDTTVPTISEITAVTTPTNDTTPNYVFTTNEAGTIAFTLGSCRSATTSATSGSNTITLDSNGSGGALADGAYTNCRLTVTDLVDFGSGNTSAALSLTSFTIATTAPALTQFATLTSSGTYTTGQTILVGAQFARTLNSASTMTVRLTNGVEVDLVYNPAYGGNIIAGNYTIGDAASGEDDSDLQIASIVSYSIIDTLGNSTTTPPSIVGITQLRSAMSGLAVTLVIETGATPVIDSISSDAANGSYHPGDVIDIDVTFSEPVTSTGSVTVTLETGTTDQTCTFTITASRTGTCNYTVQTGDTTADLDATISGTIKDRALNLVTDFTPGTTLAANKNIVIDSVAPTISVVTPVSTPTTDNTPSYTFTTNEAGTISYGGDCSSSTTSASSGSNTITFNTLADGAHTNCTIVVADAAGNASNTLSVASFTVDATAPTISVVTPVSTPTTDNTPSYTFTTNEAGTISYGGDCSSSTTSASSGSNIITFNTLADGAHTNCTITVTDAIGNVSNTLSVASFTIDSTAPTISVVTPVSTPTTDNTPNYTFTTNEAGSLSYGGDCASSAVSASVGSNAVTFAELADGAHTNCTITVTDAAGNASNLLSVASFTIDATAPVIVITAPTVSSNATITNTTIRVTDARALNSTDVTVDAATTAGHDAIACTQTSGTQVDCTIAITSSGNLKIAAQDALGNVATPVTQAGYVIVATTPDTDDTTAPDAPVIVATNNGNTAIVTEGGSVKTKTPTFQGTAEALTTVIVRDSNNNTLCTTTAGTDGSWLCASTTSLVLGSQTVSVTAMDAAGNVSSARSVAFVRSSLSASYTIKQNLISPKAKKGKYPTVAKGKTVKYTVKIKNTGEATLTKLKLTQTYPKETLQFQKPKSAKAKTTTGNPTVSTKKGTLTWNNVLKGKPLKANTTRTITLTYTVKSIPAKKAARTLNVSTKGTGGKDLYSVTAKNRTTKNKQLKVRTAMADMRYQIFIRSTRGVSAMFSNAVQMIDKGSGRTQLNFEDSTDNDFNDFQMTTSRDDNAASFGFTPETSEAQADHQVFIRVIVGSFVKDIQIYDSTKTTQKMGNIGKTQQTSVLRYLEDY